MNHKTINMTSAKRTYTAKEALERAMHLCGKAERCEQDIRNKLEQWGIKEEDQSAILKRLTDERFIDDSRFARLFAESKLKHNKWGRHKIVQALRQKAIAEHHIENAMDEIMDDEYRQVIRQALTRKYSTLKNEKDPYTIRGKLLRFALNRGYEKDEVYPIIQELLNTPNNSNELSDDTEPPEE